jgi:hypothetical protein
MPMPSAKMSAAAPASLVRVFIQDVFLSIATSPALSAMAGIKASGHIAIIQSSKRMSAYDRSHMRWVY